MMRVTYYVVGYVVWITVCLKLQFCVLCIDNFEKDFLAFLHNYF